MEDELLVFNSLTTTLSTYYTVPTGYKLRIVCINIVVKSTADTVSVGIERSGVTKLIWIFNGSANTTYRYFDFPGLEAGDKIVAGDTTATNIDITVCGILRAI